MAHQLNPYQHTKLWRESRLVFVDVENKKDADTATEADAVEESTVNDKGVQPQKLYLRTLPSKQVKKLGQRL